MSSTARLVYCQHDDCYIGYPLIGGHAPRTCPGCDRRSRWSTKLPPGLPRTPRIPFEWSPYGRLVCLYFGIATD